MVRQMPEDPMVRNIVQMMREAQVSRRNMLKGGAVAAAGAGTLALSACGGGGGGGADRGDGSGGTVVWGNWPYYLDLDDNGQTYPTLDAYMSQSNVKVEYIEDIDDNNTFFGKIKDQLALGQHTGYDVITFTDWMNARLIAEGQLQEFDYSNMPNVEANMIASERDALDSDPGRSFTVPWQLQGLGLRVEHGGGAGRHQDSR